MSKASARRWAVAQRKSTGFSGSPFSNSPIAAHMPHIERMPQFVHFVGSVAGFPRMPRR